VLVLVCLTALTGCSRGKLDAAEAQRMIAEHPRFRAPETIRVPSRYCGPRPSPDAQTPAEDRLHIRALESNRIVTAQHRPATGSECGGLPSANREVFSIALTDVANSFHPMPLSDDRGWEFAVARRRFIAIRDITYSSDDPPTVAHVGYSWQWVPELLGQLLQTNSEVQMGASATFRRTSDGWRIVQPGM
jgi:hypothetical protein